MIGNLIDEAEFDKVVILVRLKDFIFLFLFCLIYFLIFSIFYEYFFWIVCILFIQSIWYLFGKCLNEYKYNFLSLIILCLIYVQINFIGYFWKSWFFKYVEGFLRSGLAVEYIFIRYYYYRYIRSIFWEFQVKYIF